MAITTGVIAKGKCYSLLEIVDEHGATRKAHFTEFLKKLYRERPTLSSRLVKNIEYIADHGPPGNKEKFRHEEDQIYAIKVDQVRVYCFFHRDRLIVLTHGVIKKTEKADQEELKRAKRLREAFLKSEGTR
jgi:phage-related protein